MKTNNNSVLLVGSGFMAKAYLEVLAELKANVIIVGRGAEKINELKALYPQFIYYTGGIKSYVSKHKKELPSFAINTANINHLSETTCDLIAAKIPHLLIEKPGAINLTELNKIHRFAKDYQTKIVIAYNRRFYASTIRLQKEILIDGGVTSTHFEFTEWLHTIDSNKFDASTLKTWLISNSSHVLDTVFSLIGIPKELNAYIGGQDTIDWHPSGSLFIGSGITSEKIPFTYHANWTAPGRWAIEVLTKKRRFYLKPMEKLQVQQLGSVAIDYLDIDDQLDLDYKPGIYLQTVSFLNQDLGQMLTLEDQILSFHIYNQIAGYN